MRGGGVQASMRALLLLVAVAGTASADRKAAERLEQEARQSRDMGKYVACGQAYMDLYNVAPQSADGDELLYNAAVCYEEGRSIGVALQTYMLLQRYYPRSKITPRALARMGKLYGDIAQYDRAATALEEYATKYAGEKDAYDALSDAIAYRTALGDHGKRISNAQYWIKTFGAKRPDRGEAVGYSLTAPLGTREEQIKRLREYLRVWSGKNAEHRAVALVKLGDLLSAQSCPVPLVEGLCVKLVREKVPAKRCGPASLPRLAVVKRTAMYKEALASYQNASKSGSAAAQMPPAQTWAVAMATIGLADEELEKMLGASFPRGLDFSDGPAKAASLKKFNDWLSEQSRLGMSLARRYQSVLAFKDASSTVAAALRLAQSVQALERALLVGELPKDVTSGPYAKDKTEAYCTAMRGQAEPLAERALESFRVCLEKAAEFGLHDSYTRACLREAQLAKPTEYPPRELHADPSLGALAPVLEPPAAGDATFEANDKSGWTDAMCRKAADAYRKRGAHYMAGLSYHRCNLVADARRSYEQASDAQALSNLGELAWRGDDRAGAIKLWERALAKNGKLSAANTNLAIAKLEQLRAAPANRKQLEADVTWHAQSALAVNHDGTPHVVLAHVALDARKLDLAAQLLHDAVNTNDKLASAYEARGVLAVRKDTWSAAVESFERAATAAPTSDSARLGAALASLRVGRFDVASKHLAAIKTSTYDVELARGVAARGLSDVTKAEAAYEAAVKRDPKRVEAHYNLGLLYEIKARRDPSTRKAMLQKAVQSYRNAAAIDAKLDAAARADAVAKQLAGI